MALLFLVSATTAGWWYAHQLTATTVIVHHATLTEDEKCNIQSGDLILRRGEGLVSDQIAYVLRDGPYEVTHSGVVIRQGDSLCVVHSISDKDNHIDGVIAQTMDNFLLDCRNQSVIVVRYKDMDSHRDEFVQRTMYYLHKNPPFDFGFDIYDSSKVYCAELIWKLFEDVYHKDVFPVKIHTPTTDLLQYSSLFSSGMFSVVVNQQVKKQ